jgi:archaellum component FlaC
MKGKVIMYPDLPERPVNPPEVDENDIDNKAFELMDALDRLNSCIDRLKDNIKDMRDYIEEAKEDLTELEGVKTDALIALSQCGYSHI